MGDKFSGNGFGRKSSDGSEYTVYDYANWRGYAFAKRPRSKMETKIIAWITFDVLGGIYFIGSIITNINAYLNAAILVVLTVYVVLRSFIRLKRDSVALRKEKFEQMIREKEYFK